MNLRIDLAYDGRPFRGFARQPDVPTVQGEVEAALARVFGSEVETAGAGRTDAGVHALGQVMSCANAPDDLDLVRLRDALNGMCGPSISIRSCTTARDDWHARFSARSRAYVYAILQSEVPDPFLDGFVMQHPGRLDVDAMNEAAGHLVGERDFSSFGRRPEPDAPMTRTLYELRAASIGSIVRIEARANSFLHQMVRSLVGTLVEVGDGRRNPDDMPDVLEARDRAAAGAVAPAKGLCLVSVEYDEGWSRPLATLS